MGCGASADAPPARDPRFDADGNRIGYEDPRTSRYHLERKRGYLTQDPHTLDDYHELLRKNGVDLEELEDVPDTITVVSNSTTCSPLALRSSIRQSSMRSLFSPDSGFNLKSARPGYEIDFESTTEIISIRFAGVESPQVDSFSKKPQFHSPPPCQSPPPMQEMASAAMSFGSSMDQSPLVPHSTSWTTLPTQRAAGGGSPSTSSCGDATPEPEVPLQRKNVSFGELEKEPTRTRTTPPLRKRGCAGSPPQTSPNTNP